MSETNLNFEDLKTKIKHFLSISLRKQELKPRDLLLILSIFSKAETADELHTLIELFKDNYPALTDIIVEEKLDLKTNFEETVRHFISEIILENPLLAAEISREAFKKDASVDKLKQKYPEFAKFLQK